jgi:hypothetical protein
MFVNGYPFLLQRLERYHLGCCEEYVCRPTYRERKYFIAEKEPRCAKMGLCCFKFGRSRVAGGGGNIGATMGGLEVYYYLVTWLIVRRFARGSMDGSGICEATTLSVPSTTTTIKQLAASLPLPPLSLPATLANTTSVLNFWLSTAISGRPLAIIF